VVGWEWPLEGKRTPKGGIEGGDFVRWPVWWARFGQKSDPVAPVAIECREASVFLLTMPIPGFRPARVKVFRDLTPLSGVFAPRNARIYPSGRSRVRTHPCFPFGARFSPPSGALAQILLLVLTGVTFVTR
jgi:hypothetical protein